MQLARLLATVVICLTASGGSVSAESTRLSTYISVEVHVDGRGVRPFPNARFDIRNLTDQQLHVYMVMHELEIDSLNGSPFNRKEPTLCKLDYSPRVSILHPEAATGTETLDVPAKSVRSFSDPTLLCGFEFKAPGTYTGRFYSYGSVGEGMPFYILQPFSLVVP